MHAIKKPLEAVKNKSCCQPSARALDLLVPATILCGIWVRSGGVHSSSTCVLYRGLISGLVSIAGPQASAPKIKGPRPMNWAR